MARSSTRTDSALAAAALCLLAAGCSESESSKKPADGKGPSEPVIVTISVDWEGATLDEGPLAAFARFREDNPDVPLTHFVSAGYYTKAKADPARITGLMRKQMREGDEVGVHLHTWDSLARAAGVTPRTGDSYLTTDGSMFVFDGDPGFDIDPSLYTVDELRAMMKKSRELLEGAGFKVAPIFRAGGWLAGPKVLEAARAEGMTIDSSSVDANWLRDGDPEEYQVLAGRIHAVWPKVDRTTQPFLIDTPAGQLLEMPDTGGMADQVSTEQMEDHVQMAAAGSRRPVFVHLGFHCESADDHADGLTRALANLRRRDVKMKFVTLSRAAELARASMAKTR